MSEFDKLKDQGEDYARQHPEQVKKGEEALEDKLGVGQEDKGRQDADQQGDRQGAGSGGGASGQHRGSRHQGWPVPA